MADIADAADGPEGGVGRDCGRASVIPDTGSAFEDGQSPRAGFLRCIQPSGWPFVVGGGPPLVRGDVDDTVVLEDEDVVDDIDEDEFDRCGPLRDMNIRVTSSALIELSPPGAPLPVFHPNRGRGSKLGGDATAVIGEVSTLGVFQNNFSPALPMLVK